MPKKVVPIKYTSRDFTTIKQDLVNHAKRYYENSYKDFNEGSFGSLMLDSVAYVGDILSFYLDYQANESFLETSVEYNNIIKHGKQVGYKHTNNASSSGVASFYIVIPANSSGLGPDTTYAPILKKGSTFSTDNGISFILNEDVRFDSPFLEARPAVIGTNGKPASYAIKAFGVVISGLITSERIAVGDFEKFKKITLSNENILEILSVYDVEGNQYYEVDYLSQNIIYKSVTNKDPVEAIQAKEILKPLMVQRRFVVDRDLTTTSIQFGASSDIIISDSNSMITEPGKVVLNMYGKEYLSDDSFDPSRLFNSDKFGVGPSNTTLVVTYRYLPNGALANIATNALTTVNTAQFEFNNQESLNTSFVEDVRSSLEVSNDAPFLGDVSTVNSAELKRRIQNTFSAQNRAVTLNDYKSLVYSMPIKFGSVKRINVVRDDDSLKRNLNIYILAEDQNGYLTEANQTVKRNIRTWLSKNKMINDSIDILDGKVVNYEIQFVAVGGTNRAKYDILTDAINQLKKDFELLPDFGETFFINNVFLSLKKVDDLVDVVSVNIAVKNGGTYSDSVFSIKDSTSADNRYISIPKNVVMELKYPDSDIKGTIL